MSAFYFEKDSTRLRSKVATNIFIGCNMADACMRGFPGVMPHVCGNSDPLTAPHWRLKFVFLILVLSEPQQRPEAELRSW